MLKIVRAKLEDVEKIAPLFDAYRIFYNQKSDMASAKTFLHERLAKHQSIVLMAHWNGEAIGFTQLYTTYSSVSMEPFFILNDLFVAPDFRGKRIGERLLEAAKELCKEFNFKGLALETANDNPAQQLYEKLNWHKDTDYLHYFWSNPTQSS